MNDTFILYFCIGHITFMIGLYMLSGELSKSENLLNIVNGLQLIVCLSVDFQLCFYHIEIYSLFSC